MFRRHAFITALILAVSLGTTQWTYAQPGPRGEGRGRVREGDGEGRRGPGRRGPGRRMEQFYDRITNELELDDTQIEQLEEIRSAQRERMEQFRERREAIRNAERDGNEQLAEQLREEMRSEWEQNVGRRGFMEETISSIEGILTEDQQQRFSELRNTMRTEREQQMRDRFESRYERIADDLELDDDQRAVLEDIKTNQIEQMEAFRERWDAVRQAYEDGDEALGNELREELVSEMRNSGGPRAFMNQVWEELDPVLSDEQRERAEELREEGRRRWGNRGDRQRGERNGEAADSAVSRQNEMSGEAGGNRDDMASALNLSAEQQTQYAALQASHLQKTSQINTKLAELNQQLAIARETGDDAAVERLATEIAAQQTLLEQQEEAYYGQLNGMLTEAQQETLAEYRADIQIADELKGIPADLRTVLRAAMRLKLDRTQKQQVREMAKSARKDLREARKTDRENRDRDRTTEKSLADTYKTRIRNLLTTEQSQEYTEKLEKMTPRRNRGTRGI